jgi:hypothetical protein
MSSINPNTGSSNSTLVGVAIIINLYRANFNSSKEPFLYSPDTQMLFAKLEHYAY